MVTKERAREIWQTRSAFGMFAVTPEEDRYIRHVWESMPGNTCWADALLRIANGGTDDLSLEGVGNSLVAFCLCFIERKDVPISREEEKKLALTLLDGAAGLPLFAQKLRQLIAELLGAVNGFDSSRYWKLIDAIAFWRDAHEGAWPFMNATDRRRLLNWALDHARQAVPGGAT